MDAFISYSNADRKMGRAAKDALHDLGIGGFLAHDDLQVSEEWRDSIVEKLKSATIFVALLSENFKSSEWCAQEVGFAVSREDVLIIPLSLDGTVPFGFIAKLQSKRVRSAADIPAIIRDVLLKKRPRLAIPQYIKLVGDAGSYRDAEAVVAPLVPYFSAFIPAEAEQFLEAALGNSQVWDASLCKRQYLPSFLKAQWSHLPKPRRKELLGCIEMTRDEVEQSA